MAELKITDTTKSDFETVLSVPKQKFLSLLDILKSEKPGLSPQKISEKFYKTLEISQDEASRITRFIYTVNQIKLLSKFTDERIINDFVSNLLKVESRYFSKEKIEEYLSDTLKLNSIVSLTLRTADLVMEREKILQEYDIFTDIRPIFDGNEFQGMAVIHTLKLEYIENDKEKSIVHLALDNDDIKKLERLLSRAKEREASLKSNISGKFIDLI